MRAAKRKLLSICMASLACLAVSSCGGSAGSDDSGGTGGSSLNVTVQSAPSLIAENASAQVVLSVAGAQGDIQVVSESLVAALAPVTGSYVINGNTITYTVNVGELAYKNESLALVVEVSDGTNTGTVSRTINLSNTSGDVAYEKLAGAVPGLVGFLEMEVERSMYERLSSVAELVNNDARGEIAVLTDRLAMAVDGIDISGQLSEWRLFANEALALYNVNQMHESQVLDLISQLPEKISPFVAEVNQILQDIVVLANGAVPSMSFSDVYMNSAGELSQFIGNQNFGQFVDGQWVFNQAYDFMTAVVFPETEDCVVE